MPKGASVADSLPTIEASLLAELIDAAPRRVRKRLDRDPTVAAGWEWTRKGSEWVIVAGGESVRLETDASGRLKTHQTVSCSCLLSPKCFHLLACVTSLKVAEDQTESANASDSESVNIQASASVDADEFVEDRVEVTDSMQATAEQALRAIDGTLISGARASGLIVQSSLLRTAHQCRAEGLINLSSSLLRMTEGIQRLRANDDHADTDGLYRDTVFAIQNATAVAGSERVFRSDLGYARRPFAPTKLKRLIGVIAEPILTLSGYAGVVVHLIGDDGLAYQVVETRPGDASLVGQAYRGGIDLGGTTASAQTISRANIDVQNLTCSPDGRLGKGTKTRWAIGSTSKETYQDLGSNHHWSLPMADQIMNVFDSAKNLDAMPRGGWDIVSVRGTVLGASASGVAFQSEGGEARLTLSISLDHASLRYRDNLQMLARCPGLKIEVLGRVRLDRAGWIDALSMRVLDGEVSFPSSWAGRCHLGLDELKRHYFEKTERFATEVNKGEIGLSNDDSVSSSNRFDLFPSLSRRCSALVIGGSGAVGSVSASVHLRDQQRLVSRGQSTAARLLDALAIACVPDSRWTHADKHVQQNGLGMVTPNASMDRSRVLAMIECYRGESQRAYEREKWMRGIRPN